MLLKRISLLTLGTALSAWAIPVQAQAEGQIIRGAEQDDALLDVALEDLLVLESTSVAKKRQTVRDSAAAVYVISQEDIRNSPAGTIPDLLRAVPGLEVGQIANGATAVSIRGLNGRNSNSLLVMVDGRTIYVSTLSGVFWDQLNLPLQDIERIEVVRGPGATLWGANAVNGVINIITKHSGETLGARVHTRVGNRKQEAALSYGTRLAEDITLRTYGAVRRDEGLQNFAGEDTGTPTNSGEAGFRLDWEPTQRDAFTLQGDYKAGSADNTTFAIDPALIDPTPIPIVTAMEYHQTNLLARWRRQQSDKVNWSAQAYYSKIHREELGFFHLDWSIADFDFGANWRPDDTHDISFGINARAIWDEFETIDHRVMFQQASNTDLWLSGYLQNDISLIENELRLTVGAKLERNNFTGFEFQPGARIFYRPAENLGLWAAASRAVRTPSRFERDADLQFIVNQPFSRSNPSALPLFPTLVGSQDLESENLTAFESGFRVDFAGNWNLDVSAYYNQYEDLNEPTLIASRPIFIPDVAFPVSVDATVQFQSRGTAETWGFEAVLKGEVAAWWQTQLSYSNFNCRNGIDPASGERFTGFLALDGSPEHQFALTNGFQINPSVYLNTQLRYVDSLLGGKIPSYVAGDVRLRYETPSGLEVSLIGENLLDKRRFEFMLESYPAPMSFNPRSVSLELRYRF